MCLFKKKTLLKKNTALNSEYLNVRYTIDMRKMLCYLQIISRFELLTCGLSGS